MGRFKIMWKEHVFVYASYEFNMVLRAQFITGYIYQEQATNLFALILIHPAAEMVYYRNQRDHDKNSVRCWHLRETAKPIREEENLVYGEGKFCALNILSMQLPRNKIKSRCESYSKSLLSLSLFPCSHCFLFEKLG